jgi:hypothetical protein
MKGWRQALFLGGAVLLLAACSDATAPTAQVRGNSGAAANLIFSFPIPTTTTTPTLPPAPTDGCRVPVIISSGRTIEASSLECIPEF